MSLQQGVAYVGERSHVDKRAELLGEVVIGEDVIVDHDATVRDSVILAHSYIGPLLEVDNAIVAGNWLMRMDTGAQLRLTEVFMLADTRNQGRPRRAVTDQLLGALLLLLSLPLWPAAAMAALIAGGKPGLQRQELVGNRSALRRGCRHANGFKDGRWDTPIPILRHLPRLLAVVSGDLRLLGVSPMTPEELQARDEDWEMVRDQAPVGLIGPTQLDLSADAALEDRLLSDSFYARELGPAGDLRYGLRALAWLFSERAWGRRRL